MTKPAVETIDLGYDNKLVITPCWSSDADVEIAYTLPTRFGERIYGELIVSQCHLRNLAAALVRVADAYDKRCAESDRR